MIEPPGNRTLNLLIKSQQFYRNLNTQIKLRLIPIFLDRKASDQINSLGEISHFPTGGESDVNSKIISTHKNKGGGQHEDLGGYR